MAHNGFDYVGNNTEKKSQINLIDKKERLLFEEPFMKTIYLISFYSTAAVKFCVNRSSSISNSAA